MIESRFLKYTPIEGGFYKRAEFTYLFVVESLLFRLTVRIVWTIGIHEIVRHLELNHVAEIFISGCWEFLLHHLLEVFIVVIHFAEMMRLLILARVTDLDTVSFDAKRATLSFLIVLFRLLLIYRSSSQSDIHISQIMLILLLEITRLPISNGRTQFARLSIFVDGAVVIIHHFRVAQIVIIAASIWVEVH